MTATRCAVLLVSLAASLAAQGRTWIVDANNRPGTDFLDIQPAVYAAASGDTLLVRDGAYSPFRISAKSLVVSAVNGAQVIVAGPDDGTFRTMVAIDGLSPSQSLMLRGLSIWCNRLNRGLEITGCAGRIHLDTCGVSIAASTEKLGGAKIVSCALVTMLGTTISGYPALRVELSPRVYLCRCNLIGGDSYHVVHDQFVPGAAGLDLESSRAIVAASNLFGGNGVNCNLGFCLSSAAVRANRSQLTLSGDSGMTVRAGRRVAQWTYPQPAVYVVGGLAQIDTTILVEPDEGAPPVSGFVIWRRIVNLRASRGLLNAEAISGQIVSPAGRLVALLAGAPILGAATPFGCLYADTWVVPAAGAQDAGEHFPFRFVVPSLPELVRVPIALQALDADVAAAAIELSNPVIITALP